MSKGKLWKCIGVAGAALALLLTAGLLLGRAAGPEVQAAPANAGEWLTEETPEDPDPSDDILAPSGMVMLDDGFWYQGRLTDGDGYPLANVNRSVTFRLYESASGGNALDSVVVTVNTDANGLFNEEIDFNNPDKFDGRALYLSMQVSGDSAMTPRQYLRPVPYALSIRPGAIISDSVSGYDPVLEINHYYSSTGDYDGLIVRTNSGGEGVEGYSKYGKGVYGSTEKSGTVGDAGVYGNAVNNAPGVRGHSAGSGGNSYGGYFTSANRRGLFAQSTGSYYAGYFDGNGPSGVGIYVYGDVHATGDLLADGTKPAVVQAGDYGRRELYAIESPNVWFEDFGQGQLASGQATVAIEPMFLSTINTEVTYHVFVTPLGDCNGLYVTNKTATSFEVRELGGGTADVAFDYRIVAIRKDYEGVRMELATGEGGELYEPPLAPSEVPEPEEP
jgi:hypothetical protein